jgi:hypothetical protein
LSIANDPVVLSLFNRQSQWNWGSDLDGFIIPERILVVFSNLSKKISTYSSSGMFVTVLEMSHQRLLIAYPIGLLYTAFAILALYSGGGGNISTGSSALPKGK